MLTSPVQADEEAAGGSGAGRLGPVARAAGRRHGCRSWTRSAGLRGLGLVLMLLPGLAAAQAFRCADSAAGAVLYTDQPCAQGVLVVPERSAEQARLDASSRISGVMTPAGLSILHERLQQAAPLVQVITNTVVQQFSANVLLAIGAAPAMFDHDADAAQFAAVADAMLVNFGTATNQQLLAADAVAAVAGDIGKPWVLDPVSIGAGDVRTARIRQMVAARPTVIRGNASEILMLAGRSAGARGVDAVDEVGSALPAACELARTSGSIVAVSGVYDAIVAVRGESVRIARIEGGHALMQRVVGTGCSLGAAVAAYLGAQRSVGDPNAAPDFDAVVAAHAHFALAGGLAAGSASRPGSYATAFLDALFELSAADMAGAQVRVEALALADVKAAFS